MPARYGYGETKVHNSPAPSKKWLKKSKAKEMLKHGSVRGKKLTDKQMKFFGARANA